MMLVTILLLSLTTKVMTSAWLVNEQLSDSTNINIILYVVPTLTVSISVLFCTDMS